MNPNLPEDSASSNATSPARLPNFEPLDLAAIHSLSPATRRSIAWDLAASGKEAGRLSSMLSEIPLSSDSYGRSSFDLNMCAALLRAWDAHHLPQLFAEVDRHWAQAKGSLQSSYGSDRDFGALATYFAIQALLALSEGDAPQFESMVERALFLTRDASKPIEQPLSMSSGALPYTCLDQAAAVLDKSKGLLLPYRRVENENYPLAPALALGLLGDRRLLESLLGRPETPPRLAALFGPPNDYRRRQSCREFIVLESTPFWKASPELASELRARGHQAAGSDAGFPLPWAIASAALSVSNLDPSHVAYAMAADVLGDKIFAPEDGGAAAAAQSLGFLLRRCEADSSCLAMVNPWALKAFDPARRDIDRLALASMLRTALFTPILGFRERVVESFAQARGAGADPFQELLRLEAPQQLAEAISKCARLDTIPLALESWGIERAQAFPGHRKGLDSSLLMWIAAKAPLPTFEAAMDWFASKGGLREQAEAKAWVYRGSDTTKKGDLLALCVAEGKTDYARALLDRVPDLDIKPAREVAKAMAKKVRGDDGSQALSSFEDLLLRRIMEAKAETHPPAPARRARSL